MRYVILTILILISQQGMAHAIVFKKGISVLIERTTENTICINHPDDKKQIPELCLDSSDENYSKFSDYIKEVKVGVKKTIIIKKEIII